MNSKQRRTLAKIFQRPTPADLRWDDIESLLGAVGAILSLGSGSRDHIDLHGRTTTVHRPHPKPEVNHATVRLLRRFLESVGVTA